MPLHRTRKNRGPVWLICECFKDRDICGILHAPTLHRISPKYPKWTVGTLTLCSGSSESGYLTKALAVYHSSMLDNRQCRVGSLDTAKTGRTHLQCGGNQFLSTNQNPLTHAVTLRKHSGGRRVYEKVGRDLMIDVMRCAVSKKTPYQAPAEVEFVRKSLN